MQLVWCFINVKSCVTTDDDPMGAERRLTNQNIVIKVSSKINSVNKSLHGMKDIQFGQQLVTRAVHEIQ
jgi:hypothetical protein